MGMISHTNTFDTEQEADEFVERTSVDYHRAGYGTTFRRTVTADGRHEVRVHRATSAD